MKNKKVCVSVICAAVAVVLVLAINITLGCLNGSVSAALTKSQQLTGELAQGEELAELIEEEGIVMVKNDNCLPLAESDVKNGEKYQLNVFGWASIDWLSGGGGSGRCVQAVNNLKPKTGLIDALQNYKVFSQSGIATNPDLQTSYTTYCAERNSASRDTLNSRDSDSCVLYEPKLQDYNQQLLDDAKTYSGVALFVIGRVCGESNDAPKVQYKYGGENDTSRTYLDISTEEEEVLRYLGQNYQKVVVIVNSTNAVNLEFLDRIPGLSACLLVGGTGNNAVNAVPSVLFGKKLVTTSSGSEVVPVSPSGKTTDTYVYDFKSNPNYVYSGIDGVSFYQNAPSNAYPLCVKNLNVGNSSENYPGVGYLDYAEGIYVGYKWYETADAEGFFDTVSNTYGNGYNGVVQYPFGYGLSYSQFDWNVLQWKVKDGKISVSVQVKNVGSQHAKEVVQLYYTPPYVANGVEKSAVNLCAFAKTATDVAPGESRLLTLTVNIADMASYDQNTDGGKYVLGKGNYQLSLRQDAHTVKDVVKGSAIFNYKAKKDVVYDSYVGSNGTTKIQNLFTSDGLQTRIAIDGSDTEQGISSVWLSRADFQGTFPLEKQPARTWNDQLAKTNVYSAQTAAADNEQLANSTVQQCSFGVDNGIKLYENKNFTEFAYFYGNPQNYNGSEWDSLLDQLTLDELNKLVLHGYLHEEAIDSVGKPKTVSIDGPAQVGSFYQSPVCTGYPCATVVAQTWNADLFLALGASQAQEAKQTGRDGLYAPGVNLHRSAFGGRNYEYYSEDSYLSGVACAMTVRGALNHGVYMYIKHFIGYDQESYRDGMYCWMTEQTLREVYLSPFKMAIDNGATGLMSSYGRIGSVWSGGNKQLLTDLLRNEWGFKGAVVTDYTDHKEYMNGDQMIRAGGDLWMDGSGNNGTMLYPSDSLAYKVLLRQAAKHILYMWTNAAYEAQNHAAQPDVITEYVPQTPFAWWWIVAASVSALLIAGGTTFLLFTLKKKSK